MVRITLLLVSLVSVGTLFAQDDVITAELDRTKITLGETVTLVLTTNNPKIRLGPDLSPLAEHFTILDQRSELQSSVSNGRRAVLNRLRVTLEPTQVGQLTIPPLDIEGHRTQPLTLAVEAEQATPAGQPQDAFLEVEVTPDSDAIYVHSQISLAVKVFYRTRLIEGSLTQLAPEQATVKQIHETSYKARRFGENYEVLERRYAVFPQRSGELLIPSLTLSGRIAMSSRGVWQPRRGTKRIRVSSDPLHLKVLPRPASYSGQDWLPARQLRMTQNFGGEDSVKVGEPITRRVMLDAIGLEDTMLVEPKWPEVDGARIYPDLPEGITRDNGSWVLGHREFGYAIVPERSGRLELPPIELTWWDVASGTEKVASLPGKVIEVTAVSDATALPVAPVATAPITQGPMVSRVWPGLTAAFALLWLITLWLWHRSRIKVSDTDVTIEAGKEQPLVKTLKRACENGQTQDAIAALRAWCRFQGFSINQIDDAELQAAVQAAQCYLYAADSTVGRWDGGRLWKAFHDWRRQRRQQSAKPPARLPELYPR